MGFIPPLQDRLLIYFFLVVSMNLLCEQAEDEALEKTIREYNQAKNSVARDE